MQNNTQPECVEMHCPAYAYPHQYGSGPCGWYATTDPSGTVQLHDKEPNTVLYKIPDDPTFVYEAAIFGLAYGSIVLSVVNGTLCANPITELPISYNFDGAVMDLLPPANHKLRPVILNRDTLRYEFVDELAAR